MLKKFALLIGVSQYASGLAELPATLKDVEKMQLVLEDPDLGGFQQVKVLINPDTLEMQKAIHNLFKHCKQDDLVLLYFCGHGLTDDNGKLFLAAATTGKDEFQATGVPASFVHDMIVESPSHRKVVILDCCYSGAFSKGWQTRNDDSVDIKRELGAKGCAVLVSSSAVQRSFENEKSGLYTYYLVEGIETGKADRDGDGSISVNELHEYARENVKKDRPTMEPQLCISEQEGYKIVLSEVRSTDPESEYRRLVESLVSDAKISTMNRIILDRNQEALGLTKKQAQVIEDKIIQDLNKRVQNLQAYEQALKQAIQKERFLSDRTRRGLRILQKNLKLSQEDVDYIEQRVIPQKMNLSSARRMELTTLWRSLIFLGVTGFIISFIFIVFFPNYQAGVLYNQAYELQENDQYEAAIKIYDRVIELNPNFVYKALANRGYLFGKLGEYGNSLASCNKALELNSDDSIALNCRGIAYRELGKYNEAIKDFNLATQLDSKFTDAFNNRGETYLKNQEYSAAIDDFDRVIQIDSKFVFAWNNKGKAHLEKGKAHLEKGESHLEKVEVSTAVNAFKTATELQKNSYTAWIGLGDAYKQDKQDIQAKSAYEQATFIQAKTPEDWYYVGQARERLEQPKEAIAAYGESINIRPNYKIAIEARQRLQKQQEP